METTEATTEPKTVAESEGRLPELIDFVDGGKNRRVVVERDGKPIAAVISYHDLQRLEAYLERRARQMQAFVEISRRFDDVSDEELEREVSKAVAEARAELRAEREQVAVTARSLGG